MNPINTEIYPYTGNSIYFQNPNFREESKQQQKSHIFDNKIIQSHLEHFEQQNISQRSLENYLKKAFNKTRSTNALLHLPSLIKRPGPGQKLSTSPHLRNNRAIQRYLENVRNNANRAYLRFQHNNAILRKKKPKIKISMDPQQIYGSRSSQWNERVSRIYNSGRKQKKSPRK